MKMNLRMLFKLRPVIEAALVLHQRLRAAIDASERDDLRQALDDLLDVEDWMETLGDLVDLLSLVRTIVTPEEWQGIRAALGDLIAAIRRVF